MTEPRVDRGALAAVYGGGVDAYDTIWSPAIRPGAVSVIDAMTLVDASRVLDVGAGTGAMTENLCAAAPRRDAPLARSLTRHVALCAASIGPCARSWPMPRALPCAPSSVDAALLAYVLFHLLDPPTALHEAARVLRVGGRVGTVTWASETPPLASKVWDETLDALRVPRLPALGNHDGLETTDAISSLLDTAGLRPVDVWIHDLEHTFTSEDFWNMRTGGGINRARLAALDTSSRTQILSEVRRRLDELAPTDYTFRGAVVCAVGEKVAWIREARRTRWD